MPGYPTWMSSDRFGNSSNMSKTAAGSLIRKFCFKSNVPPPTN